MNFNKRLRLFLFGFIFGCIFVLFIYNRKDTKFNYLPNDRVIGDFKKPNGRSLERVNDGQDPRVQWVASVLNQ